MAHRLPERVPRWGIVAVGIVTTAWLFVSG